MDFRSPFRQLLTETAQLVKLSATELWLFTLGMFPEYVATKFRYTASGEARPKLFGRLRRSAEDFLQFREEKLFH